MNVSATAVLVLALAGQLADGPWPTDWHDSRNSNATDLPGPTVPRLEWTREYLDDQKLVRASWDAPLIGEDGGLFSWVETYNKIESRSEQRFVKLDRNGKIDEGFKEIPSEYMGTPVLLDADRVLICGVWDRHNEIWLFNSAGEIVWSFEMDEDYHCTPPKVGPGGEIYVFFNRYRPEEAASGTLFAFKSDRQLAWKYPFESPFYLDLAIDPDGTIFFLQGGAGELHAIDPDGTVRWRLADERLRMGYRLAIGLNGLLYVGRDDGIVVVRSVNRRIEWVVPEGNPQFSIGVDGTLYYIKVVENLYVSPHLYEQVSKLTAVGADGSVKWDFCVSNGLSGPIVDGDGTVYVGDDFPNRVPLDSHWVFLRAVKNGKLKWVFGGNACGWPAPGDRVYGPMIGRDRSIYFTTDQGRLYALGEGDPDGGGGAGGCEESLSCEVFNFDAGVAVTDTSWPDGAFGDGPAPDGGVAEGGPWDRSMPPDAASDVVISAPGCGCAQVGT
ncbi:MAG: PQQ-like beta-propeller repeat protein [Deltaproteobacteria bacterium]|nr:PQQ-like beta-propeller repeat protein [Deltaproteobacteria bacterium]